jgi:hypothetical protein
MILIWLCITFCVAKRLVNVTLVFAKTLQMSNFLNYILEIKLYHFIYIKKLQV